MRIQRSQCYKNGDGRIRYGDGRIYRQRCAVDLAVANHVHAHRYVIFYSLSVFPSHLRLLNGQAKVRYCHKAVAMFCGVTESTYRPYLCTDYTALSV